MKNIKILSFICAFATLSYPIFADVNPNTVNAKFGINLMQDANLWDDSAEELTKRLGAKFEKTKTAKATIYSTYANGKILKTPIEQMRIAEVDGKVAQIDMVFFNKGDSATGKSWNQQMQRTMKKQWDTLEEELTTLANEGKNGTWGFGRTKNKAKIWNYENIVLSLEFKPKEFIILHLTSPKGAQIAAEKKTADGEFDGTTNVKKGSNGDVYIANIPMVNQGEKGYCVPATIERVLKYYQIPGIDMHKIAAVCKTNVGGGTTIPAIMSDFKKVSNTFKLRMSNVGGLSFNAIRAQIDKGIPICWIMISPNEYIERMLANTQERQTGDFEEYCKKIRKQKKIKKDNSGHICLIIGYNMESKEIAVSNSWGEKFDITWTRFDDAKPLSINAFVINPR